jgi:hypothetical protein
MTRSYRWIWPLSVLLTTGLLAGQAAADSYYLRTGGGPALLPGAPVAATATFKDSPSLNRTTFKEVGMWAAAPAAAAVRLAALADLRVWVGLKNSDDQGTYFDVRADVLRNGVTVASGEVKGIQGVTRNPDKAKEVVVPFGPIGAGDLQAGDVLSLRVLTKVADTGGHSNAVGLRLYYDGVSRPSRFGGTLAPAGLPEIRFTSPASGGVVRDPALVVEGEITAQGVAAVSLSMAMTLEGQPFDWPVPVAVSGGRFAARVGLIPGPNELLARVTDAAGQSAEATVLLTFEPDPPDYDMAPEPDVHPRSGFAPLAVTFGAGEAADPAVTVVDLDTDGDGQAEFTLTDFAAPPQLPGRPVAGRCRRSAPVDRCRGSRALRSGPERSAERFVEHRGSAGNAHAPRHQPRIRDRLRPAQRAGGSHDLPRHLRPRQRWRLADCELVEVPGGRGAGSPSRPRSTRWSV